MIFIDHLGKWFFAALFASVLTFLGGGILFAISLLLIVPLKATASRSVEASNLRQIGQASLIYASDHRDRLPEAVDLPDFARLLALGGGLNDAGIWVSQKDGSRLPHDLTTVLVTTPEGARVLDPRFSRLPHLFTVVIGGLTADEPSTTPLAWTRGLNLETGRWREDSPYRGEGGHILFLGGNVQFFRSLQNGAGGALVGRDGRPTHRIRDALPLGVRISEESAGFVPRPGLRDQVGRAVRQAPEVARAVIPFAWLVWMLALFIKLTLVLARRIGVPFAKLRYEPRVSWLLLSPIALLALSYVFRL
jgi:hypothetical protein